MSRTFLDDLVGRQDDVHALREALVLPARLICIRGAPGVGKSVFVRCVLKDVGDRRVVVVDLRAVQGVADALHAIARAVGIALHGMEPGVGADRIAAALDTEPTLLWLDHIDAAAGALVDVIAAWLEDAPNLQVITSGWCALGVSAERVLGLEPLGPPDAARLLLVRVQEQNASVVVRSSDAAALAARGGGLPLAIELLACRVALLGVTAALVSTAKELPLESGAEASLQAAWALLSRADQQALVALSTLRGAFDVATGVQVVGGAAPFEAVLRLRARSLVHAPAADVLELLPAVRAFVEAEARRSGLWEDAERRHCAAFAARVGADPHGAAALRGAVRDRDDLLAAWRTALRSDVRAALTLAHALEPLLLTQGPLSLMHEIITATLSAVSAEPHSDQQLRGAAIDLALALGRNAAIRGHHRAALVRFEPCLEQARALNDDVRVGFTAGCMAYAQCALGALVTAQQHAGEALALGLANKNSRLVSFAEQMHGHVGLAQGAWVEADAAYRRSLAAARRADAPRAVGIAWGNLAVSARARGDVDAQAECLHQARAIFEALGERFLLARLQVDEAMVATQRREPNAAMLLRAGLDVAVQEGCIHSELVARAALVQLAVGSGDWQRAALEIDDFAAAARGVDDVQWEPRVRAAQQQLASQGAVARLSLSADGRMVKLDGRVLDFSRRRPLRLVLLALVHTRFTAPGKALSADDVRQAGWPGEKMSTESGAARVYMAIRRLRDAGFAGCIATSDEGYMLDPRCVVEWC